jgi:hypothetical protein
MNKASGFIMAERIPPGIKNFQPRAPEREEWRRCAFEPQACAQIRQLSQWASTNAAQKSRHAFDTIWRHTAAVQKRCHTYERLTAIPGRYRHVEQINALPCDQLRDAVGEKLGIEYKDSDVFGKEAHHGNTR